MDFPNLLTGVLSSLVTSVIWTMVLYRLRPKLQVESVQLDASGKKLVMKVAVANRSRCYAAQNLQVECAVVDSSGYTYHFKIDREDFLVLPARRAGKDNRRSFALLGPAETTKAYAKNIDAMLKMLNNSGAYLRVRVRGEHEITGFGRVLECRFIKVGDRFQAADT